MEGEEDMKPSFTLLLTLTFLTLPKSEEPPGSHGYRDQKVCP